MINYNEFIQKFKKIFIEIFVYIKNTALKADKFSNIFNIILTSILTIATVVLAILNYKYIKLTQEQLSEIKSQRKFSEMQMIINNTPEITILTPKKEVIDDKLFIHCSFENQNGTARNVEFYGYIVKTNNDKTDLLKIYEFKSYVNNINSNKMQYFDQHLPDSFEWIKQSMSNGKDPSLMFVVIIKYVQSAIFPEETNQTKFESASFYWSNITNKWANLSGMGNVDLIRLIRANGYCPEYPAL